METERMNVTMAVDPGVRKGYGVAIFSGSRLVGASMEKNMHTFLNYCEGVYNVTECVIEMPVVRATGQQKGRQSDIIDLAAATGIFMGMLSRCYTGVTLTVVYPEQWKRQIPKDIACSRIRERLTDEEVSSLPRRVTNDMLDAIGIGFWKFDRERALV